MLLQILRTSLLLLALVLYAYCAVVWLRIWRNRMAGSAHACFLITISLFLIVGIETVYLVSDFPVGHWSAKTHDLVIPLLFVVNAVFNVAFAEGYFRLKE